MTVEAHGPLERYQPLTLPWPLYEATVRYQKGVWRVEAYSSIGGPQPQAYDLHVEVGKTLRAGVYAGRLADPALRPRVCPVHEVVPVDVFVPGCPPSADTIFATLTDLLEGRRPELSGQTRFGA